MNTLTQAIQGSSGSKAPKRWLFFGDSTVLRLFKKSPLLGHFIRAKKVSDEACPQIFDCRTKRHGRCRLPDAFGMNASQEWLRPDFSLGEGPARYGLGHPQCQDCSGCMSVYTLCSIHPHATSFTNDFTNIPNNCTTNSYHGGYFGVEFARDKEIQTTEFGTTQEVVDAYIQQHINHDAKLNQVMGGLPVCVVSMGLHDLLVPNITLDLFAQNMDWFLRLLANQCQHIMWLPNAAPLQIEDGEYPQTQATTQRFNDHITHQVLPQVQKSTNVGVSVLDVWDASIGWPHDHDNFDNVHMDDAWYVALGTFLVELSQTINLPSAKEQESAVDSQLR